MTAQARFPNPPDALRALGGAPGNLQEQVNDSYLIERRVRQHPFFDQYTDSCTQTLRVYAFTTSSGEIEIIAAILKLVTAGRAVDNIRQGGMVVPLDEHGVMGTAMRSTPEGSQYFNRHPETGYPIAGMSIPDYGEAVKLAIEAQSVIPQLRLVGWDVAISETGPVLLEGNFGWTWEDTQKAGHKGLIRGALADELHKVIGSRSGPPR